jgi:hypothetical protein
LFVKMFILTTTMMKTTELFLAFKNTSKEL